jgi:drug/metabolite transporter (DMT)-like permease
MSSRLADPFTAIPRVPMRPIIIAGIVLLCLGLVLLVRGGSFTTRRDVLKVGDVKVTADEQQSIPPWAGYVVLAAGVACVLAGTRKPA